MPPRTSNFARQKDDFYPSPPGVIDALLKHVYIPDGIIWECAAGDGALLEQLEAAGRTVVASDLIDRGHPDVVPRVDFLMETALPPGCKCVITNPPFRLADEFIRKGLDLGAEQVILLLPLKFIGATGADRWENTRRISDILLMGRLKMLPPGAVDKGLNPTVDFAWFVFRQDPQVGCRLFNSKSNKVFNEYTAEAHNG